jgi:hypothetical protein
MLAHKRTRALAPDEQEPEVLERLAHIAAMLRKHAVTPKQILDVAGNPTTSAFWATTFPAAEVFCLNIRALRHSPHLRIRDITHDLVRSPAPVRDCDFVFAGEIVEHVYDLPAFTENLLAAAAPGAYVAVTTPNLATWANRLLLLVGEAPFNYDAIPVTMPRLTWLRAEPRMQVELSMFDYHIRVFTMTQLAYWLDRFCVHTLERDTVMSTRGRWAAPMKRALGRVLPSSMKDTLVVLGRYDPAPR